MDWLWKSILIILLAPIVIGAMTQAFFVLVAALLPYVIVLGVVIGIVGGLTAGLVLRRQLPPPRGANPEFPIPPPEAVRRPRGPRRPQD